MDTVPAFVEMTLALGQRLTDLDSERSFYGTGDRIVTLTEAVPTGASFPGAQPFWWDGFVDVPIVFGGLGEFEHVSVFARGRSLLTPTKDAWRLEIPPGGWLIGYVAIAPFVGMTGDHRSAMIGEIEIARRRSDLPKSWSDRPPRDYP